LLEGWRAAITVGTNDGPLTGLSNRKPNRKERLSQTSFGHLSINSSMILMVLMAMKRP